MRGLAGVFNARRKPARIRRSIAVGEGSSLVDPVIPLPFADNHVLDRYRHALGQFVEDFSWMEVCLFKLLCAAIPVPENVGQALFSGARAEALIGNIRRCYGAHEHTLEPYLDAALGQATSLNSIRNEVVHFATFAIENSDEAVYTTNQFRYLSGKATTRLLTPELLHDLSFDAQMVSHIAQMTEADLNDPGSPGEVLSQMRAAKQPWRYRPEVLGWPRRKEKSRRVPAPSSEPKHPRPPQS